MKWVSHQIITTSAVLVVTGSPALAVMAGAMSPLPDKIDHICGVFGRMPIRMFNHREHSHYWGYWAVIAIFAYAYMKKNGVFLTDTYSYLSLGKLLVSSGDLAWVKDFLLPNLVFWGALGSLFHIFEDFFSGMGVPLVFPNKISPHISLYKTGGISEYLLTAAVSFVLIAFYMSKSPTLYAVQNVWIRCFQ